MTNPWIRLLRPKQWIKNAFVFAPLFFSGRFGEWFAWELTLLAAAGFFAVSCVVYIVNDIRDIEEDRKHPIKRNRPLAAGDIPVFHAVLLACAFAAVTVFLMTFLPGACAVIAVIYVALNIAYTYYLKRIAIVDVFFIAFCYVLRVLMGGYALSVVISPWIVLTTFLLALFLGFGKRYHEMGFEDYAKSKPNLQHYSRDLLDRLVTISGCSALLAYAIYAAEIAERSGQLEMSYTVAFVAFGLFRYMQSIHVYQQGGEPETIIFTDRLQLANVVLWLLTTLWIMF